MRGKTPDYPPPFWRPEIKAQVLAEGVIAGKGLFLKTKSEQGKLHVGSVVAMQPYQTVHVEGPKYVGVLQENCSLKEGERSRWKVAVDRELVRCDGRIVVMQMMWPRGSPDIVNGWYSSEDLVELEYLWEPV